MPWTSASHSHWAVSCLGGETWNMSLSRCRTRKSPWLWLCVEHKNLIPQVVLVLYAAGTVGMHPFRGGLPRSQMSWFIFAYCFPLLINLSSTVLRRFTWALKLSFAEATQQKQTSTAWELLLFICKLASHPGWTDILVLHIHPISIL